MRIFIPRKPDETAYSSGCEVIMSTGIVAGDATGDFVVQVTL
jgi:hypothetical protein